MYSNNSGFCKELNKYSISLIRKLKVEEKSDNTITTYNRTFKDFIKFCSEFEEEISFENIKENHIYEFLEWKYTNMNKQGDLAISTKYALIIHLKRLFRYIEKNSNSLYDFDKVFEDIKLKIPMREPKGLTKNQINTIIRYIEDNKILNPNSFIIYRNALLFKIMLYGGLRASEAISIKLSNIQDYNNDLYKFSFKGKGNKKRVTYIKKDSIEDEVETIRDDFKLDEDIYIATTKNNKQMDRVQLSKMVNSIYTRAKVKVTGVHILRHTAAKELVKSGVNITVIQSLLGHENLNTTAIYANPTEDMLVAELSK